MRHAFLSGADWSAYAARRGASTSDDGIGQLGLLALRPMTEAGLPLANAYNDRSWASVE
jgi:hypothetical protein